MLRIHRTKAQTVVFMISGRLGAENVNELSHVVDSEPTRRVVVLDLSDLILADRVAVDLLREYETRGRVVLRNCPAYIRTLMAADGDQS